MDTVHTKENPVYCHMTAFLLPLLLLVIQSLSKTSSCSASHKPLTDKTYAGLQLCNQVIHVVPLYKLSDFLF